MSIKKRAVQNFKKDLNCAQSVLSAYSKILGLDEKSAEAVTFGFGEGMGFAQKTCGAVTGGIMVIGYKYYDKDDLKGSKERAYKKINEFFERFKRKHDSSDCRNLLGVDLRLERERLNIKKKTCLSLNVCSV